MVYVLSVSVGSVTCLDVIIMRAWLFVSKQAAQKVVLYQLSSVYFDASMCESDINRGKKRALKTFLKRAKSIICLVVICLEKYK